jgi:hypothetical protein
MKSSARGSKRHNEKVYHCVAALDLIRSNSYVGE